ncbi:hypothetical protein Pfo_018835 [Paulownia fortunei]|nr:hypothetical protein Pfo_018835 [Paulownia fortunei]
MEIDFLGLNSPNKYGNMEQQSSEDVFTETANGVVETSLSLSTSSSLDCKREILNFCEKKKKKTWAELPCDKMIPSCSGNSTSTLCSLAHYNQENAPKTEQPSLLLVPRPVFHPSSTPGLLFDLNDKSTDFRNISELQAEPASLTMLYSGCANVLNDTLPEKAENTMYKAGKSSTGLSDHARICTRGHTPTVAMARRATLARFLEKRSHRMNQARTSHLLGKSVNATNPESCDTTVTRSNKKRNNSLIRA